MNKTLGLCLLLVQFIASAPPAVAAGSPATGLFSPPGGPWVPPVQTSARFPLLAGASDADGSLTLVVSPGSSPDIVSPSDGHLAHSGRLSSGDSGFVIRHAGGLFSIVSISSFWEFRDAGAPGRRVSAGERLGSWGPSVPGSAKLPVAWAIYRAADPRVEQASTFEALTVTQGTDKPAFASPEDVVASIKKSSAQVNTMAVLGRGALRLETMEPGAASRLRVTLSGLELTGLHTQSNGRSTGSYLAAPGSFQIEATPAGVFRRAETREISIRRGEITTVRIKESTGTAGMFELAFERGLGLQAGDPLPGALPLIAANSSQPTPSGTQDSPIAQANVSGGSQGQMDGPAAAPNLDSEQSNKADRDRLWAESWARYEAWRSRLPQSGMDSNPLKELQEDARNRPPSTEGRVAQGSGTDRTSSQTALNPGPRPEGETGRSDQQAMVSIAQQARQAREERERLSLEIEAERNRRRELELQLAAARAQTGDRTWATQSVAGTVRTAHALVIGNAAYPGSARLDNPINDANAISGKLRELGFAVTTVIDAERPRLLQVLSQFARNAANTDLSLFFFSGHGVQIDGTNFILPIDIDQTDAVQATLQGVSLNTVVENFMPGNTRLVFLDACRDNPLRPTGTKSISRGLAPISVAHGTLIAYATKDGQTASDGIGSRNSPFTKALLEHLDDPADIGVVLRTVREKVLKATGGKQQPWEYGSLTGGELVLSRLLTSTRR